VSGAADAHGVRCMLMRGGTSKGAYFLAADLPADPGQRDDLLLRIMGSPDARQIDGIGGAHPLTSKVAVIWPSDGALTDVHYLFLQVGVDQATVSDRQNCGNLLAGVGPFAVERGLVPATQPATCVRIKMVNSGEVATAEFATPAGLVDYSGSAQISGVPGTAAPVVLSFAAEDGAGPSSPFPTGRIREEIDGVPVTCVDAGMPTVLVAAASLGVTGEESPAELEAMAELGARVSSLRLAAGTLMGLGDVRATTVPKVTLVSEARFGGTVSTRTFIPVRCHESIGVLCAVGTAVAARCAGTIAAELAAPIAGSAVRIEHPSGHLDVEIELDDAAVPPRVVRAGVVRTARKLFDGTVFPRELEGQSREDQSREELP
jgi:4-oxalomesaconate tautomerase